MSETSRIDSALARFDQALLKLETEAARKNNDYGKLVALARDAEVMGAERQRLARDLELLKSKAMELVDTSKQASGKIDQAMSRIRAVLHSNSAGA
jgi:Domain of unknown function (DUF4164)